MPVLSSADLQEAVRNSFLIEVNALKPGNVSRYADGHDMTVADFTRSAELVTPVLCDPALPVGQRILMAVRATMQEVGCNTNLGMLLLFAPLVRAAEQLDVRDADALRDRLGRTLAGLDKEATQDIFTAIREANPGGLGQSSQYDVHLIPDCSIATAMQHASERDLIAKQYVTDFSDIFLKGLGWIKEFHQRWNRVEWAAVGCYLAFLSGFPDTHIQRKHGQQVADTITKRAKSVARVFYKNNDPEAVTSLLLDFDKELKDSHINPGTSADLTAASLLVHELLN